MTLYQIQGLFNAKSDERIAQDDMERRRQLQPTWNY